MKNFISKIINHYKEKRNSKEKMSNFLLSYSRAKVDTKYFASTFTITLEDENNKVYKRVLLIEKIKRKSWRDPYYFREPGFVWLPYIMSNPCVEIDLPPPDQFLNDNINRHKII